MWPGTRGRSGGWSAALRSQLPPYPANPQVVVAHQEPHKPGLPPGPDPFQKTACGPRTPHHLRCCSFSLDLEELGAPAHPCNGLGSHMACLMFNPMGGQESQRPGRPGVERAGKPSRARQSPPFVRQRHLASAGFRRRVVTGPLGPLAGQTPAGQTLVNAG